MKLGATETLFGCGWMDGWKGMEGEEWTRESETVWLEGDREGKEMCISLFWTDQELKKLERELLGKKRVFYPPSNLIEIINK